MDRSAFGHEDGGSANTIGRGLKTGDCYPSPLAGDGPPVGLQKCGLSRSSSKRSCSEKSRRERLMETPTTSP